MRTSRFSPVRSQLRRAVIWLAVFAVLAVVFMAYAHPRLMIDLAEQVWACF